MKFDKLQIGKPLEKGDWRSFYEGIYTPEARSVVVEVLDVLRGAPQEEIEHLRFRAKNLALINNPNISKMLTHGEQDGLHYLAIEKESDIRLADHLSNGDYLPPLEATRLVLDMASGLKAIHDLGFVYGDLRPTNVLFSDQGQVKLRNVFQFRQKKEFMLEVVSRRPHYVSPEHIRMDQLEYGSDQYTLGIMYFQLLTGRPPYDSSDIREIWKLHIEGDIPTLPIDLNGIDGLENVVRTLLAKRPKFRYPNDDTLITALEEIEDILMMMDGEKSDSSQLSDSFSNSPATESRNDPAISRSHRPQLDRSKTSRSSKDKKQSSEAHPSAKNPHGAGLNKHSRKSNPESPRLGVSSQENNSSNNIAKGSRVTDGRVSRNWKKGTSSMSYSSRSPHKTKSSSSKSMWGISVAALIMSAIILYVWLQQYDSTHEKISSQVTQSSSQKYVIKSFKQMEAERLGLLEPNGSYKKEYLESLKLKENKVNLEEKKNANAQLEANNAILEDTRSLDEKNRDEKIAKIKSYVDKPLDIAIPHIGAFLEDSDAKVRFVANQIYRDLKGGTLISVEDMDRKLENDVPENLDLNSSDQWLAMLKKISNNNDPQSEKILKDALEHKDENIRHLAIKLLYVAKNPEMSDILLRQLKIRPWDRRLDTYADQLNKQGLESLKDYTIKGDARDSVMLLPFWANFKDDGVNFLMEVLKKRPDLSLSSALVLVGSGMAGCEALVNLLFDRPSDSLCNLIISALREIDLDKQTLMRLEVLYGQLSLENNQYLASLLASRGRPVEKETNASPELKVLVALDDLPKILTELDLDNLFLQLNLGNRDQDLRILKVFAASGVLGTHYLEKIIRGKLTIEIKRLAIESMRQYPNSEAISILLEVANDSQTRSELVKDLKTVIATFGSVILPVLMQNEKLSAKDKVGYLIPMLDNSNVMALVEIINNSSESEGRKSIQALLDVYPTAQHCYNGLLRDLKDSSKLQFLLKGLSRCGGEGGIEGSILLLNDKDTALRNEAYQSLKQRMMGERPEWYKALSIAGDPKIKSKIINNFSDSNPNFSKMIDDYVGYEDEDCRKTVIEKLQQLKIEPTMSILSRLINEKNSTLKNELMKYIFSFENPHAVALVWGQENLSGSMRKKINSKLTDLLVNKEQILFLTQTLSTTCPLDLKMGIMRYLISQDKDIFEDLYAQIKESDPSTLKLFHEGVLLLGSKATALLLKKLDVAKSAFMRDEIEGLLKQQKVKYVLDPRTGHYMIQ